MDAPNNPAARLFELIRRARDIEQATPGPQGWAKVFDLPDNDLAGVLQESSRIVRMIREVKEQIIRLAPEYSDVYLQHYAQVEHFGATFTQLYMTMGDMLHPLKSETGEYCLKVCSTVLARNPDPGLEPSTAERLLEQIRELLAEIEEASDLPDSTKSWVLQRLREILRRLQPGPLYSANEVSTATETLVGGLLRKLQHLSNLRRSVTWDKFLAFVVAVDLAVNLAANSKELLPGQEPPAPQNSTIINQLTEYGDVYITPALPQGSSDGDGKQGHDTTAEADRNQ